MLKWQKHFLKPYYKRRFTKVSMEPCVCICASVFLTNSWSDKGGESSWLFIDISDQPIHLKQSLSKTPCSICLRQNNTQWGIIHRANTHQKKEYYNIYTYLPCTSWSTFWTGHTVLTTERGICLSMLSLNKNVIFTQLLLTGEDTNKQRRWETMWEFFSAKVKPTLLIGWPAINWAFFLPY